MAAEKSISGQWASESGQGPLCQHRGSCPLSSGFSDCQEGSYWREYGALTHQIMNGLTTNKIFSNSSHYLVMVSPTFYLFLRFYIAKVTQFYLP